MAQKIFQAEAKTTKKKNTWNPLLGKLQVCLLETIRDMPWEKLEGQGHSQALFESTFTYSFHLNLCKSFLLPPSLCSMSSADSAASEKGDGFGERTRVWTERGPQHVL